MTQSDDDLRQYSLVLVGHGLLNPLPGAEPGSLDRARALVRWAAEHGHGLYQLPVAGYRVVEGSDAAGRRRMGREDAASLRFVFSQLREYLDAGYRLSAVVLEPADTSGASGRAWMRRLASAAEAEEVSLPQPMTPAAILDATAD